MSGLGVISEVPAPAKNRALGKSQPIPYKSTTTESLSTDTAMVSATYGPFTTLEPGLTRAG